MVDIKGLKKLIEDSGMTMVAFSNKTGILRATMYNRLSGQGEFTVSEIESISETLHLTVSQRNAIFFAKSVE